MNHEPESRWTVPHNWVWTTLSELGDVVAGGTPSTKEPKYWTEEVNWISPADLTGYSAKTIRKGAKSISRIGLANSSAKVMPAGSVHFSTRAPIGYVVISSEPLTTNQGFKSLVPAPGIFNEYVYYYFMASRDYARKRASGTTFLELSGRAFGDLPIPLAPTATQHTIVAKIEELFSELDKGVESLKTARAMFDVYRQAVLKHVFEGRLTAQWREENQDKIETPEQLFARIKQEREARYEQQLQEWKVAVKKWEKNGRLKTKPSSTRPPLFPEPFTDIELMALPEISCPWLWVKVGQLFSVYVGATPSRKKGNYWNGAINWITSGEVHFAPINKTNETITPEGLASASTEVHPIGTVMLAMIGEGKTRGQAAVTHVEACHNQNTAAIRVSESEISPEYVYYYLLYRYEDTRRIGSGNNQKALNKERVSNLPIPLPPLEEQAVIVQELKKLLSVIEQLDGEIGTQLASADALRQAILKKAFAGQLVPQDPNDEPATILLERIRAEKAARSQSNAQARRRRTAATA